MILKWLEKKLNQEHNKKMLELGRSWTEAVRTYIEKYKSTKDDTYLEAASRFLTYAESYLDMVKK